MFDFKKCFSVAKQHSGLVLIFLTWAAFFSRILIGRYVYFLDDLQAIYYPLEYVYAQFQHSWTLPVWSNYFGFGHPLIAWGQLGFFTPVHLILRALYISPINLLQASVVIYFALGLLGMFYFLRNHKIGQSAAAFGSIIFVFSGFNIGHLNHVNFYTGTMVLPWLLLAVWAFLTKPTLRRAIYISLAGACMALSAQPQVVIYCFIAVVIYALVFIGFTIHHQNLRYFSKVTLLSLLTIVLALGLSSFAIFPVKEFLPITERNDSLSETELLDFSYPPHHAITLIAPYFFGDSLTYWGPKGFQELAAFVGVIPLLLAGVAMANWKKNRPLRTAAILLFILGPLLALGTYSPLYKYLVESRIITSFSIPGRFVLFFDLGVALLSALAIQDIKYLSQSSSRTKILKAIAPAFLLLILILIPFVNYLAHTPSIIGQQLSDTRLWLALVLVIAGASVFVLSVLSTNTMSSARLRYSLILLGSITLLIFGWDYNPLTLRSNAAITSPFTKTLTAYARNNITPPRLYSREDLLNSNQLTSKIATSVISPSFSFIQPIVFYSSQPCINTPLYARNNIDGTINIDLKASLGSASLETINFSNAELRGHEDQAICWPNAKIQTNKTYYVSFTSNGNSGINLFTISDPKNPAYWIRKQNPTTEEIQQSLKPLRLYISNSAQEKKQLATLLLTRHLQATANSSGARWIGALSIRPYREFIEMFFANDSSSDVNGNGMHVLETNRGLFNMVGVTHFIQELTPNTQDTMTQHDFTLLQEDKWNGNVLRLYQNPEAYPKAFLVDNARFVPADDDQRAAMVEKDFDPKRTALINGTTPPSELSDSQITSPYAKGTADITKYTNTHVDVKVTTPKTTWLILSDTSTPEWHTYIDGKPAPYYTAYTMFRAAQVPAGKHVVSFVYSSPAIELSKMLTVVSIVITFILFCISIFSSFFAPFTIKK